MIGKIYQLTLNKIPHRHSGLIIKIKRYFIKYIFNKTEDKVNIRPNIRPNIKFANGEKVLLEIIQ